MANKNKSIIHTLIREQIEDYHIRFLNTKPNSRYIASMNKYADMIIKGQYCNELHCSPNQFTNLIVSYPSLSFFNSKVLYVSVFCQSEFKGSLNDFIHTSLSCYKLNDVRVIVPIDITELKKWKQLTEFSVLGYDYVCSINTLLKKIRYKSPIEKVTIRKFDVKKDQRDVRKLEKKAFAAEKTSPLAFFKQNWKEWDYDGIDGYVAMDDTTQKIIGFVGMMKANNSRLPHLSNLAVDPQNQRNDVAINLISTLIKKNMIKHQYDYFTFFSGSALIEKVSKKYGIKKSRKLFIKRYKKRKKT